MLGARRVDEPAPPAGGAAKLGKLKPTVGGLRVFWPKEKVFEDEAKFEE
jgi:hypothetical protein